MTNQASEDIVDSILSTLGIVDRKSGNRPGQIQVVKQIIRTEKLKLLDRLESADEEIFGAVPYWAIEAERNKLKEVK